MLLVLILLVATLWISEPLYSSYAIDRMLKAKAGAPIDYRYIFGAWFGIFILNSIVQTSQKFLGWKLTEQLVLSRREEVYTHILDLGISFHTKQKSGEVIKILDDGADTMAELQRELLIQLIPSSLTAFVFLVIGFIINPLLATILLVSICLYMIIAFTGTRSTVKLQQEVNKLWVESIGRAQDTISNIYSVKSGAQEKREMDTMRVIHQKTFSRQQKVNKRWAAVEAINFFMLTRIALVSVGIYLYTKDILSLGQVYFFQSSFFRVLTPFEMLGGMLPQWNKQVSKVRLSEEVLNTAVDVHNKENPVTPGELKGEIRFEHVSFQYDTVMKKLGDHIQTNETSAGPANPPEDEAIQDETLRMEEPESTDADDENAPQSYPSPDAEDQHAGYVLKDIDLVIRPGEHIAFVGHSGAGKTTIAMLLNRFYDVTEGRILIDGTDLRDLDMHWWRSQIGLVLQENIMFNESILENIRYARPDATIEEVKEAARRAAADEFIDHLADGYNTMIGDRGIRLSGGQRQRVAIARAILKRPKIVVLDEATSALDSVTEKHVQEGIKSLIEGRTACIIAHRLSTVRAVDRIAVFSDGRLIDIGPHDELVKSCAIYREMVELQSQGVLAEK
ncbi:MAG: hypothetical protein JWM56_1176 [Candidatus Peribacteria bacterium]|nr:hypothetical protein [Candidatus Peribacteria bacterium]